jgi:hypothetical protein
MRMNQVGNTRRGNSRREKFDTSILHAAKALLEGPLP